MFKGKARGAGFFTLKNAVACRILKRFRQLSDREIRQTKKDAKTSLPNFPKAVIVFHDEAVKFLSTDRKGSKEENDTLDKIAETIRQAKKDGVKMEVCMYAVKIFGVDPDTIMPEIEKVENGWISVSGYQAQGYSLITVP